MYEFPYGAGQQLNLNWIINEIITLHKQLDPDWDLPQFDTAFPYTNLNTLNLDWILRELKAIKDLAPTEDTQLLKMVANALIANTYDAETQYNVDDIVYRDSDNRLYKCITATPAGGEPFDSNKWVEVDVGGVLTDLLNSVVTPPAPYDNSPAMDGTASAGTSTQYARGDHVHPKDTARVPTSRTVNGKALSSNITLNASDIPNNSNVTGDNTDDALNTLNSAIGDEATARANADTALQNTLNNIGTVITGEYLSTEIPNATVTDIMSVTLTNGTWIIFGYFNYGAGFSTGRALSYLIQGGSTLTQLNIDTGATGGGAFPLSTLVEITDSSPSKTIRLSAYQTSGTQQTITTRRLNAVRIK